MNPTLKLYLLIGTESGYDTYSEIIVTAYSEEEAKLINPNGCIYPDPYWRDTSWVSYGNPSKVRVKYIGEASPDLKPNTVLLTSFHSG